MADQIVGTQITADPAAFNKAMADVAKAAQNAAGSIDRSFKGIADTASLVNGKFVGLLTTLAGGGALKKFITDANDWNGTAGRMAAQLGITAERASVLNTALTRLGIDSDVYTSASQKLSKQIFSNADAFKVLGVQLRDSQGNYRPVVDLMGEVNAKLVEIKNPIEQNIAGQQVYGKGWAEVRGILRLTADQMAEADARARELGLIVGPEGVAASKQYTAQMRDLGLVGKSMEIQFGNKLIPVFIEVGKIIGNNVTPMAAALRTVLEAIVVVGRNVGFVFSTIAKDAAASAQAFMQMQKWDFAGSRATLNNRAAEAANDRAKLDLADMQTLGMGAGAGRGSINPGAASGPNINSGPRYAFKPDAAATTAAEKSRMAEWEAALAQQKAVLERGYAMQGQFRELTKAEELSFWQEMAKRKDLTESEKTAISRKAADVELALIRGVFEVRVKALETEAASYKNNTDEKLRIERQIQALYAQGTAQYEDAARRIAQIERQAAQQRAEVARVRVEMERDMQAQQVALAESSARQQLALGLITQADMLQAERGFEDRRYTIAAQALADRLELLQADPDRNPAELQRLHREQEQLAQAHQLRMHEIGGRLVAERAAGPMAVLQTAEQSLTALGTTLVTHWRGVGSALRSSFVSIGTSMIQELVTKPLAARIVAWARERAFAIAGIEMDAAKAGAGAAASQASIPIAGPWLALGALATVFAAVSAMRNSVPSFSAASGFDIPSGVNPMVQTHAREMILPQRYADVIRTMADQAGPGSAGGGGMAPVTLQGVSAGEFFIAARADLVKVLHGAVRDNALRLKA